MTCPKCGNKSIAEGGTFLGFPGVSFSTRMKLVWFWVTIAVKADLMYCQKCGFSAVQNIRVS